MMTSLHIDNCFVGFQFIPGNSSGSHSRAQTRFKGLVVRVAN